MVQINSSKSKRESKEVKGDGGGSSSTALLLFNKNGFVLLKIKDEETSKPASFFHFRKCAASPKIEMERTAGLG